MPSSMCTTCMQVNLNKAYSYVGLLADTQHKYNNFYYFN